MSDFGRCLHIQRPSSKFPARSPALLCIPVATRGSSKLQLQLPAAWQHSLKHSPVLCVLGSRSHVLPSLRLGVGHAWVPRNHGELDQVGLGPGVCWPSSPSPCTPLGPVACWVLASCSLPSLPQPQQHLVLWLQTLLPHSSRAGNPLCYAAPQPMVPRLGACGALRQLEQGAGSIPTLPTGVFEEKLPATCPGAGNKFKHD